MTYTYIEHRVMHTCKGLLHYVKYCRCCNGEREGERRRERRGERRRERAVLARPPKGKSIVIIIIGLLEESREREGRHQFRRERCLITSKEPAFTSVLYETRLSPVVRVRDGRTSKKGRGGPTFITLFLSGGGDRAAAFLSLRTSHQANYEIGGCVSVGLRKMER